MESPESAALRDKALTTLRSIPKVGSDTEMNHVRADDVLCDLLRSLGYGDVVDAWEDISKWYA